MKNNFSPPFVPDDSPSDSGPVFEDMPDWRPQSQRALKHHIYRHNFTPKERKMLAEIPENDVTSEIYLLRILLARNFEQLHRNPSKKDGLWASLNIDQDVFSTFSRAAIVLASLVASQNKSYNPKTEVGDEIKQALRDLDPYEDLE